MKTPFIYQSSSSLQKPSYKLQPTLPIVAIRTNANKDTLELIWAWAGTDPKYMLTSHIAQYNIQKGKALS